MDATRFVTLTLRHTDASLGDQLRELRDGFRRLRQSDLWKKRVAAGIYTVEVTRNAGTGRWHPHLHCIVDGAFIPQRGLSQAWEKATRGSTVVDIRLCHSRKGAAKYIGKYIAKPQDIARWPASALREYAAAMSGQRIIATVGKLHGVKLDPRDPNADPVGSQRVCSLAWLYEHCRHRHARVVAAVAKLKWFIPELHSLIPWIAPANDEEMHVDQGGELQGAIDQLLSVDDPVYIGQSTCDEWTSGLDRQGSWEAIEDRARMRS